MKMIYMAHPVRGDIKGNRAKAKIWLKWLTESREVPTLVLAPWLYETEIWDDHNPEHRAAGLERCKGLIERCDELWAVGGRITEGMEVECLHAIKHGKTVVDLQTMGEWPPDVTEELKTRIRFLSSPQMLVPDGTARPYIGEEAEWCPPGGQREFHQKVMAEPVPQLDPDQVRALGEAFCGVPAGPEDFPGSDYPPPPAFCTAHCLVLPCHRCEEDAESLANPEDDYPSPHGIGGPPPDPPKQTLCGPHALVIPCDRCKEEAEFWAKAGAAEAKRIELEDTKAALASMAKVLEAWRVVAKEWDAWYKRGMQGMIPYESVKAAERLELERYGGRSPQGKVRPAPPPEPEGRMHCDRRMTEHFTGRSARTTYSCESCGWETS